MKLNLIITLFLVGAFLALELLGSQVQAQSGKFDVLLRTRQPTAEGSSSFNVVEAAESWNPNEIAVIVCDMWDSHHCFNAVGRVEKLAVEIDEFVAVTRSGGATIIHAPSSCMDYYKNHSSRNRAIATPMSTSLPDQIGQWCYEIPSEAAGEYPIDQTDGGEDDDPADHERWVKELESRGLNPKAPWKRQIDTIKIDQEKDYVSVDGKEIWSILEDKKIKHVLMVGVHTNMCVLGRPFGLRQLAKNGRQVALVRDLTDSMYNPAAKPFVDHHTGTDLIVQHIEKYVCPTVTRDQIDTSKSTFRFPSDTRKRIAVLIGEREYKTDETLPRFAIDSLGKDYKVDIIHANPEKRNDFPGIARLSEADVLLISVRRRTLPKSQLEVVRKFVAAGKPVIGIRTASHAFCLLKDPTPEGLDAWPEFDADVFGGSYHGHHANKTKSKILPIDQVSEHEILKNVSINGSFIGNGSLYKVTPLADSATSLLMGQIADASTQPVAWFNRRADGGVSFYTSLGHVQDFENPEFRKMLKQAIDWTARETVNDRK